MNHALTLYFLFMTLITTTPDATASEKKLPICGNTPNCVSSQAKIADKRHYIAPFEIKGDPNRAWEALKTAVNRHSRMAITHENATRLHAEATTLVFRFIDDIDALLDADALLIHIRSASRVGHSDLGVNRRRIEKLRKQLQKEGVIE